MSEYWTGFEAGLEYSKHLKDARRSDEELKAIAHVKRRLPQEPPDLWWRRQRKAYGTFTHPTEPCRVSLSHWGLYEV